MCKHVLRRVCRGMVCLGILACSAWGYVLQAQPEARPDSLQEALRRHPARDTTRVNTLLLLARKQHRAGNYDDALFYAAEAKEIARQTGFSKGEGDAWIASGQIYLRKGLYDSALADFGHGQTIFLQSGDEASLIDIYMYTGQTYDYQARYKEALEQYDTAMDILPRHPNDDRMARLLNSIGITYFNRGSYDLALDHYLRSIKISAAFPDKLYYAATLNNIGVVKMTTSKYEDALKYFTLYLQTAGELQHPQSISVALSNMGEAYIGLKQYKEANKYLDSARILYGQRGDKRGMSFSASNLGDSYRNIGWYLNAETYYLESIRIAREINSDEALVKSLLGLTDLYIRMRQPRKAEAPLEEVRAAAIRSGAMPWLEKVYLYTSRLDSARGDYTAAYHWFRQYAHLKDSLFNEHKSQQVVQMQELYESEKKDKEIALLSEARKVEEIKLSANKNLLMVSVGFFVVVIAGILYWVYVKSRHARQVSAQHAKLSETYEELKILVDKVADQNKMLATKNDTLEDLHREKDALIGIVAHDLRSPLNRIAGLATLLELAQPLDQEGKDVVGIMQTVCAEGNGLIRDLLEINQYEQDEKLTLTLVSLSGFIGAQMKQYAGTLERKDLSVAVRSDPDTTLYTDAAYLSRILDNIVTNAVKFSPPGRSIFVETEARDEQVLIRIRDEGPGFHPDDLSQVFRKFKKLSARPTGGESSTGLGLAIVKSLVEKLHGTIALESVWGQGATFLITLPARAAMP